MTHELAEKFGIENMVTDGGNGIVIGGKKDIKPLDKSMMINILDVFEREKIPWSICINDERIWYCKNSVFPDSIESSIKIPNYMETKIVEDLDYRSVENIYKGFAYLNREQEKEIVELREVTYTRYHDEYIILEADDKSKGIDKILDIMGVDDSQVVVFGDNTNDIKMFRPQWTKIAMGNAVEELKEMADYVTTDADKDGIENACRYFNWID